MPDNNPGLNPDGTHSCPGCMTGDPGGGGIPPELALALQYLDARKTVREDIKATAATGPSADDELRNAVENLLTTYAALLNARARAVVAVAQTFRPATGLR